MVLLNNKNPQDLQIIYKSKNKGVYRCEGSAIFEPEGNPLILGFCFHHYNKVYPTKLIKTAIKRNLGIIYVCDTLPNHYIVDDHIVYVVTGFEWFTHLLFKDITQFKGVFHNGTEDGKRYANIVSSRGMFRVPLIQSIEDLKQIKPIDKVVNNARLTKVLIETFDGLGDVLMSLPSAKTLAEQGHEVHYLVHPHFVPIFKNLDFVKKVYSNKHIISTSEFGYYISLTHKLSDYRAPFNQQHRIFSTAYFFGLAPKDLVIKKPIIVLDHDEMTWAVNFLSKYSKSLHQNVGICWQANGDHRSYLPTYTQKLCTLLSKHKYIPYIISANPRQFDNSINLGGKLTLRQMFSLVWSLDYIITVDTGVLHVAGAFDKPTIALMGPIVADWRCSTYKNCYPIEPKVTCFPCADRQWVPREKQKCKLINSYCLTTITPNKIIRVLNRIARR